MINKMAIWSLFIYFAFVSCSTGFAVNEMEVSLLIIFLLNDHRLNSITVFSLSATSSLRCYVCILIPFQLVTHFAVC